MWEFRFLSPTPRTIGIVCVRHDASMTAAFEVNRSIRFSFLCSLLAARCVRTKAAAVGTGLCSSCCDARRLYVVAFGIGRSLPFFFGLPFCKLQRHTQGWLIAEYALVISLADLFFTLLVSFAFGPLGLHVGP